MRDLYKEESAGNLLNQPAVVPSVVAKNAIGSATKQTTSSEVLHYSQIKLPYL